MQRITISRDDHAYACFPDIARLPDGALVIVYRECMGHGPWPFSRLLVRRSIDEGMTWSDSQIISEAVHASEDPADWPAWTEADSRRGWAETNARLTEDWQRAAAFNCPRMLCLADGSLLLVCDLALGHPYHWENWFWRSLDGGLTWTGPERPALAEGIVPQLTELRDGRLLLGLNMAVLGDTGTPFICTSTDGGHTWAEPIMLPAKEGHDLDETAFVELEDGTLVGFGRNFACERAHRPSAAIKVISRDGGQTWSGPFDTWIIGCEGRIKGGLLRSGEVCLAYRCDLPNEMLALHLMTQEAALLEDLGAMVERQPVPGEDTTKDRPWYMTSYYPGRTVILDQERSVHRDGGYPGWVQLPSGDLYVVDYINDDAPLGQIRGHLVSRSDIILFPPGDLPWLHPGGQPFRAITQALAERQLREADPKS